MSLIMWVTVENYLKIANEGYLSRNTNTLLRIFTISCTIYWKRLINQNLCIQVQKVYTIAKN